jgi:hypothetical protein
MSGWTAAWLGWLLMFLAIEAGALLNKQPGDTLSEHVWRWFSVKRKGKGWRWRRAALATFLAWLLLHLTGIAP